MRVPCSFLYAALLSDESHMVAVASCGGRALDTRWDKCGDLVDENGRSKRLSETADGALERHSCRQHIPPGMDRICSMAGKFVTMVRLP